MDCSGERGGGGRADLGGLDHLHEIMTELERVGMLHAELANQCGQTNGGELSDGCQLDSRCCPVGVGGGRHGECRVEHICTCDRRLIIDDEQGGRESVEEGCDHIWLDQTFEDLDLLSIELMRNVLGEDAVEHHPESSPLLIQPDPKSGHVVLGPLDGVELGLDGLDLLDGRVVLDTNQIGHRDETDVGADVVAPLVIDEPSEHRLDHEVRSDVLRDDAGGGNGYSDFFHGVSLAFSCWLPVLAGIPLC